jgi:small subunit ribosomal protein S16
MIRYQLVGKKHDHSFRIILTEKRTSPHGKMQERLGFYNPKTKETKLEKERITYWIEKGAQVSDSVWNLLVKNGVIKGAKRYIPSAQYKPKVSSAEEKKDEIAPKKEGAVETKGSEEVAEIETPTKTEEIAPVQ